MNYIPFHRPHIPQSTYREVNAVLKSGWLTTGPKVKDFEKLFGQTINSKKNIAVSSCTSALHLAYLANKIGPGDEVIVPSFTFCSTINTLLHVGAIPIFCDIDEKTLCLDPNDVKKRITNKTKAIVVVHFAGMPADMDIINSIANKYNLSVVEDAAHAFMTKYKGRYIGSSKNTTCFSFYVTKNITTSEGGMITTPNKYIADYVQQLSMHGISKNAWNRYGREGTWVYDVVAPGFKYNMTDLEAVIGIEQLKLVKEAVKRRKRLATLYNQFLKNNRHIILPTNVPYRRSQHSWHLYTIRIKETSKVSRDLLIEELKTAGIGTSVHFIPNHLQSYYQKRFGQIKLPITEKVFQSILSLPFYEDLKESEIKYICNTINNLTN